MTAADRFRDAVRRRDLAGLLETLAPDVELHSPTMLRPVIGRERLRPIFLALADLFEDFEYIRIFKGSPIGADAERFASDALMFRCRIGDCHLEGIDVLDIDDGDQIVRLTVLIRPLAGLQALGQALTARLTGGVGSGG